MEYVFLMNRLQSRARTIQTGRRWHRGGDARRTHWSRIHRWRLQTPRHYSGGADNTHSSFTNYSALWILLNRIDYEQSWEITRGIYKTKHCNQQKKAAMLWGLLMPIREYTFYAHALEIQVEMSGWTGSAQQELVTVRTGREATSIDVKLTVDNSRPFERGSVHLNG